MTSNDARFSPLSLIRYFVKLAHQQKLIQPIVKAMFIKLRGYVNNDIKFNVIHDEFDSFFIVLNSDKIIFTFSHKTEVVCGLSGIDFFLR